MRPTQEVSPAIHIALSRVFRDSISGFIAPIATLLTFGYSNLRRREPAGLKRAENIASDMISKDGRDGG